MQVRSNTYSNPLALSVLALNKKFDVFSLRASQSISLKVVVVVVLLLLVLVLVVVVVSVVILCKNVSICINMYLPRWRI